MVDDKDILILEALKRNARASVLEIAKETGLPNTTVHNRIKKLRKDRIIERYTIKVNEEKIGKKIAAYVSITVDYQTLKKGKQTQNQLAAKIAKNPGVLETDIITGESDILVKVRLKSIEELNEFVTEALRNLDGVEKTQTMVILKEAIN